MPPVRREERGSCRAGLGHPLLPLCPQPIPSAAAPGLRSGESRAQEPGTLPWGPLEALLWAGTTEGSPMSWGCSQVRAAPAPPRMGPGPCPVAHAHSPAASAIGSGQLCPPGDNHLLLLLLLQSPPQPRAGPGAVPAALNPALCPQSAALRSQHPSGFAMEPAWGQPSPSVSLAATSPSLWAWAGTGMWEVRRGHGSPGTAPGAAGGSRFAPSHHLTSI